ncbi:unnamed protein product [Adineta ricciae]|uniref:Uncharacterized protein n=1 Tax=Adineta ricciae TaxID=249248 RepID=A0A815SI58_ADIRI|nr:unnamed protein product [Adineta ricciae]
MRLRFIDRLIARLRPARKIEINSETTTNQIGSIVILKKLLSFGNTADYVMILVGILAAVIYAIGHVFFVFIFGELVGLFVERISSAQCTDSNTTICQYNNTSPSYRKRLVTRSIELKNDIAMFRFLQVIGLIQILVYYIQYVFFELTSCRLANRIRVELFKATLTREVSYFDVTETSISNLFENVAVVQSGIGWKSAAIFSGFIFVISSFILALVVDWKLTLVVCIAEPLSVGAAFVLSKLTAQATLSEIKSYGQAATVAEEVFSGIRTVIAFNAQNNEQMRYESKLKHNVKYALRKGFLYGCYVGVLATFVYWTSALGYLAGTWLKITGRHPSLSIRQIVVVVTSITEGMQFLGYLAPSMKTFLDACTIALPIMDFLEESKVCEEAQARIRSVPVAQAIHKSTLTCPDGEPTVEIVFDNVSFAYPSGEERLALNKVSFRIKANQTVAFVGSSGSGKSTCIQLLLRFYDPLDGQIRINGHPINTFDRKALRQNIGLVSQEPVLFATTIRNNIGYGKENATFEEIVEAAKQANAHPFIDILPQGYETVIGDQGVQLSGGQRQRIALARALIRQPSLLLLDEATSALDSSSEKIVQETIEQTTNGRTTIIVAHRLSTIRYADWIIVMKDGSIVEQGSHDDLFAARNFYYQSAIKQQVNLTPCEDLTSTDLDNVSMKDISTHEQEVITDEENNDKQMMDEVHQSSQGSLGCLIKLFKLNASEWPYLIVICLSGIVAGGFYPSFAYILAETISAFQQCDPSAQMNKVIQFTRIMFLLGIGVNLTKIVHYVCLAVSGARLTDRLRMKSFAYILRQEVAWFDKSENNTGSLCARLSADAMAVQSLTNVRLGLLIESLSLLLVALIIGLIFSWQLTLMVFGLILFELTGAIIDVRRKSRLQTKIDSFLSDCNALITQTVRNIRTVFQLTREEHLLDQFQNVIDRSYKIIKPSVFKGGVAFAFSFPIATLILPCLGELAVVLLDEGLIDHQRIVLLFAFVPFSFDVIQTSAMISTELGGTTAAARRLNQLFERIPLIDNMSTEGQQIKDFSGAIQFDRVTFAYPTRSSVNVLHNFQLTVRAGMRVAIVGSSGCGKSTLAQLLERFYDCNRGRVLLDGHNVRSLKLGWLRAQIGLVNQEPNLILGLTVAENISYGCLINTYTHEDVVDAAKRAHCHTFIEILPQGYDTPVGLNGSSYLSGGQKQRIAIARALFRKPKILLLDEATSALDVHNEQLVEESLNAARQDDASRTVMIIAHRLSTIQSCDVICVLGPNGRLLESGTHRELIVRNSAYRKLVLDHM